MKELNIESLDLQSIQECALVLAVGSVRVLDVSYNAVGGSGLFGFLSQLCPTEIVSLNLSATASSDDTRVVQGLILMLAKKEEFSKLTSLNLSDCRLRDEDVWHLLKCVGHVW
jgi:hypothetical protein